MNDTVKEKKGYAVGFICPMACELDAVTRLMEGKEERQFGALTFYTGRIGGGDTVAVKCGVGKVFAAVAAEAMILGFSPDLIVTTGVAGNLSSDLSIGDVVVSTAVVQHDMDTSPIGDPVGLISGINKIELESDVGAADKMCACLDALGIRYARGVVASGDQFIASDGERGRITSQFGALCCEMEGAAVGQVAYMHGVPFLVLRALSDDANGNSPDDFPAYCVKVSETSSKAIAAFMNGQV